MCASSQVRLKFVEKIHRGILDLPCVHYTRKKKNEKVTYCTKGLCSKADYTRSYFLCQIN